MMRIARVVTAMVVVLLAASSCTQAGTPAAAETPAHRRVQVIDVRGLLYEDGDLPTGYTEAPRPEGEHVGSMWRDIATPNRQHEQWFAVAGENKGSAQVFLYGTQTEAEFASAQMDALIASQADGAPIPVSDLGEHAPAANVGGSDDLTFHRCRAAVYIRLGGVANISEIVTYARRLDERLMPPVCP